MFPPWRRGRGGESAVGGGLGRSCRRCRNRPVCIYSCLTQHNLIFHIKDQIIFQLQLITHPKSTSKGRSSSASLASRRRVRPDFTPSFSASVAQELRGSCPDGPLRLGQGAKVPPRPSGPLLGSHSQLMGCLPAKIVALVAGAQPPPEEEHSPHTTPKRQGGELGKRRSPHLLDEETEARKGEVICPSSHSLKAAEPRCPLVGITPRNLPFLIYQHLVVGHDYVG